MLFIYVYCKLVLFYKSIHYVITKHTKLNLNTLYILSSMNSSKKKKRILFLIFLLLSILILLLLYFPFGSRFYVCLNENKVLVPTVQFSFRSGQIRNSNVAPNFPTTTLENTRKQAVGTGAMPVTDAFKAQSIFQKGTSLAVASASQGAGGGSDFNNTGANNAMAMFGMMPIFNPNFNNLNVSNGDDFLSYNLIDSGTDPDYSKTIPVGNHWFAFILMACAYCCCIYIRLE